MGCDSTLGCVEASAMKGYERRFVRKGDAFPVGKRKEGLKGGGVPGLPVGSLTVPQKGISLRRAQLMGRPTGQLLSVKTLLETLAIMCLLIQIITCSQRGRQSLPMEL